MHFVQHDSFLLGIFARLNRCWAGDNCTLPEVGILGDDHQIVGFRIIPEPCIGTAALPNQFGMAAFRELRRYQLYESCA